VKLAERMIEASGVELCTEAFGDPAEPPILLVMGMGGSMLWWEDGFCRMLADGRRFVIRYDHRDTGRSVTYEPGYPEYTGADLVADAAGVLDADGIPAANVVGVSAGGAFAQLLALDFADRVRSLVLISTSGALPGGRELPPATEEFARFLRTAQVDWSDAESVIEYLVAYTRVLVGGQRPFDETAAPGRGASRCEPADPRGGRSRGRPARLGDHRPRDPRAYRPTQSSRRTMTAARQGHRRAEPYRAGPAGADGHAACPTPTGQGRQGDRDAGPAQRWPADARGRPWQRPLRR
jgi:pimeloyl-ACP methyl ester carboxylesterase